MIRWLIAWAERGIIPDAPIRVGIRGLLRQRLRSLERNGETDETQLSGTFGRGPIAVDTDATNRQHYELPTAYFQRILGKHLKYSSCFWPAGCEDLSEAEAAMLDLSSQRAELADGQRILELGCGWGSFTFWIAERFPRSSILAMSNSLAQRAWIENECRRRGFGNVEVRTADINRFEPGSRFDRIVSVEMFEHLRNYRALFERLHDWLEPQGKLFVHVFSHSRYSYLFETAGDDDWMGRYFFTGGTMPSHGLLPSSAKGFDLEQGWRLDGRHYQRTLEAWLARQDRQKDAIMPLFRETYGDDAAIWFQRWRIFFMACAELFGYRDGSEWGVSHYRFARR